jgi:hypothetical protein
MSSPEKPTTRPPLGLGGLTSNAMPLIPPGAFLWLIRLDPKGAPITKVIAADRLSQGRRKEI